MSVRFAVMTILMLAMSSGCERPAPLVETVDPRETLRQMSATLAAAPRLTFKARRYLDAALVAGSSIPESADVEVAVSRPEMVRARMVSSAGARRFYADGRNISLLDERMNLYATVPAPGTIDDVVEKMDEQYGFTPPLAEFVLNDAYRKFSSHVQTSAYRGKETVNGVECDRLTLTGEIADADLWVSRTDHLPRRFVATFKDREGSPQMKIEFVEWDLAATFDPSTFTFDPPKGAERIVMDANLDAPPDQQKPAAVKQEHMP